MAKYSYILVMPVPKDKIEAWRKVGALSGKIYVEHGALACNDWIADPEATPMGEVTGFQRSVHATEDEVIGVTEVVFASKEAAAAVNAAYEADPRMAELSYQYDPKRAFYGGFELQG